MQSSRPNDDSYTNPRSACDPRLNGIGYGVLSGAARGTAGFLGAFSLLNVLGSLRDPGFNASHWWIIFPGVPGILSQAFLVSSAILLLAFAFQPAMSVWRRWLTGGSVAILLLFAINNAVTFFSLLRKDTITAGIPLPLSLLVAMALVLVLWMAVTPARPQCRWNSAMAAVVLIFCTAAFPLCQMVFFGKTDYRRPADAAVVFGARAYADGRPSDALADRVRTACQLYLDGTVSKLIFSGGPGDAAIHETESMRRMAIELGVRDEDILVDVYGLNTDATVVNTLQIFEDHEIKRVIAVSHAFHLPRIKMAYQRKQLQVYTVPAEETYFLRQMPYLMIRETAAWWVYYARHWK